MLYKLFVAAPLMVETENMAMAAHIMIQEFLKVYHSSIQLGEKAKLTTSVDKTLVKGLLVYLKNILL